MANKCRLCVLNRERIDLVCQTDHFYVALDRIPATPGHMILFPKRHVVSVFNLRPAEWADMQKALKKAKVSLPKVKLRPAYLGFIANPLSKGSEAVCRRMLNNAYLGKKPDAYNIGINEGRAAGRMIDHLHIHIIPRFFGDVSIPDGGVRNLILK